MTLRGIIPPLVTPMRADESIDLAGLKSHIDWLLAAGVHGIFVLEATSYRDEIAMQEVSCIAE